MSQKCRGKGLGRWPTVVLLLHITTAMANLSSWFPQFFLPSIVLHYVAAIFDAVHISHASAVLTWSFIVHYVSTAVRQI